MPAKKPLRAVSEDERGPAKATPKTIVEAAEKGTSRELLDAVRLRLAQAVQDPKTPPRDLAALTKRLVDVTHDIETIDAREEQEGAKRAAVTDATFDSSAI